LGLVSFVAELAIVGILVYNNLAEPVVVASLPDGCLKEVEKGPEVAG